MKMNPASQHTQLIDDNPDFARICKHDHRLGLLAMRDAMNILGGKWRVPLIGALCLKGKMRFSDLIRELDGIGAKMLSKELQELEMNQLITRTVVQTKPITVEYEMTTYGLSLKKLIGEIITWGIGYREHVMRDPSNSHETEEHVEERQSARVC